MANTPKTVAQAKEPLKAAERPKAKGGSTQTEHSSSTVNEFLAEIGIKLTEAQERQVEAHLRLKTVRSGKAYIRIVDEIPADLKLGPQERALVEGLSNEKPMSKSEWVQLVSDKLNTRQNPMKVLNFYTRDLEAKKLIKAV